MSLALKQFQVKAEEAAFIGRYAANITAANAFGLHASVFASRAGEGRSESLLD